MQRDIVVNFTPYRIVIFVYESRFVSLIVDIGPAAVDYRSAAGRVHALLQAGAQVVRQIVGNAHLVKIHSVVPHEQGIVNRGVLVPLYIVFPGGSRREVRDDVDVGDSVRIRTGHREIVIPYDFLFHSAGIMRYDLPFFAVRIVGLKTAVLYVDVDILLPGVGRAVLRQDVVEIRSADRKFLAPVVEEGEAVYDLLSLGNVAVVAACGGIPDAVDNPLVPPQNQRLCLIVAVVLNPVP